jgi:hypothetical protein
MDQALFPQILSKIVVDRLVDEGLSRLARVNDDFTQSKQPGVERKPSGAQEDDGDRHGTEKSSQQLREEQTPSGPDADGNGAPEPYRKRHQVSSRCSADYSGQRAKTRSGMARVGVGQRRRF